MRKSRFKSLAWEPRSQCMTNLILASSTGFQIINPDQLVTALTKTNTKNLVNSEEFGDWLQLCAWAFKSIRLSPKSPGFTPTLHLWEILHVPSWEKKILPSRYILLQIKCAYHFYIEHSLSMMTWNTFEMHTRCSKCQRFSLGSFEHSHTKGTSGLRNGRAHL